MLIDHLVYAVPDLRAAVADVEERLGVRARDGGRHTGPGTYNALLALAPGDSLPAERTSRSGRRPGPRSSPASEDLRARWCCGDASQGTGKPLGLMGVVGALPPLAAKMIKVATVKCGGKAKGRCCLTRA